MTAPETFTVSSKRPLTTGRRPDKTGVRPYLSFHRESELAFTARGGPSKIIAGPPPEHPTRKPAAVAFNNCNARRPRRHAPQARGFFSLRSALLQCREPRPTGVTEIARPPPGA